MNENDDCFVVTSDTPGLEKVRIVYAENRHAHLEISVSLGLNSDSELAIFIREHRPGDKVSLSLRFNGVRLDETFVVNSCHFGYGDGDPADFHVELRVR
jgi:hypothetical protein